MRLLRINAKQRGIWFIEKELKKKPKILIKGGKWRKET